MENRSGLVVGTRLTQFAWVNTGALQAQSRFRGTERVGWAFTRAAAAYDLIRLPRLLAVSS